MFIDKAKITVRSGSGGNGIVSFKREKFLPFGGPNGGNGGRGGDVYLVGSPHMTNLQFYFHKRSFAAEDGGNGGAENCVGKSADPFYIKLPFGTEVYMENSNKTIEIIDENPILILKGGKGGVGNGQLKTSVNRAPTHKYPAEKGEEEILNLKLKTIAHIGLVGFPNAGKSSFLNSFTNAKSRVEPFPFSTVHPVLGTYNGIKFIDIPGIVKDAHKGKGMGITFLQHIERCKILLIIIDSSDNPLESMKVIMNELGVYGINLPWEIVLNKSDLLDKKGLKDLSEEFIKIYGKKPFVCSTKYNYGVSYILRKIIKKI